MTKNMVHLTSRVPQELIDKVEALAKQRRMQTGENASRADLVREALEALVVTNAKPKQKKSVSAPKGELSLLAQALNCPDEHEAMRLALDVISQLAHDAQQRGLLADPPQDMGMAVWNACDGRKDLHLITDYVSKLHGALRAL